MNADADSSNREPSPDELLLQRYVDGELRASERRDLEARLESEPDLVGQLSGLRTLRAAFAAEREVRDRKAPLGMGFADRVWAELRREARPPRSPSVPGLILLKRWTLAAASIVVLLGAALLFWNPGQPTVLDAGSRRQDELRALERRADEREAREEEAARRVREGKEAVAPAHGAGK